MTKSISFKTLLSLTEIREAVKKHPLFQSGKGGESYYLGVHFNVEFSNGVTVKIYDTATADAFAENARGAPMSIEQRRRQIGYEMDVQMPNEEQGERITRLILKAINAYEIKTD